MRFFFAFILLLPALASASLNFQVHFSPVANLVYQLDCASGQSGHCSEETYKELWKNEFLKSAEDEALLKKWGELIKRYQTNAVFEESETETATGRFNGVALFKKLQIAASQSQNLEDYLERLDLLAMPKDKLEFEKIVLHFEPRFAKWWRTVAFSKGTTFSKQTQTLLNRSDMAKKIKQFAAFYEAKFPDSYTLHFNLYYRPDSKEATSGQQNENYSIIEFLPNEKAVERLDVVIHELCHFFFENAADDKILALKKKFEESEDMGARSSYNLINEGLATVFGNGLICKMAMEKKKWDSYLARPLSFYNNPTIDKASKAILPWIEEWPMESKSLYHPEFIEKYMSSLNTAFGQELTAPSLLLNELVVIVDDKFSSNGEFRQVIRKSLHTSSMYSSEGKWSDERMLATFNKMPQLSSIFIVHNDNLIVLKEKKVLLEENYDLIKKGVTSKIPVLYATTRGKNVPLYVIMATTKEEVFTMIEKLAGQKMGLIGFIE